MTDRQLNALIRKREEAQAEWFRTGNGMWLAECRRLTRLIDEEREARSAGEARENGKLF